MTRVLLCRTGAIAEVPVPAAGRATAGDVAEGNRHPDGSTGRSAGEVRDRSQLCHRDVAGTSKGITATWSGDTERDIVVACGRVTVTRVLLCRTGAIAEVPVPVADGTTAGDVAEDHRHPDASTGRRTREVRHGGRLIDGDQDTGGVTPPWSGHQQQHRETTGTLEKMQRARVDR